LVIILGFAVVQAGPALGKEEDSVIIERNLFDPERKKWQEEEKPEVKQPVRQPDKDRYNVNAILLFGTVVHNDERYAVLRTGKGNNKSTRTPYTTGDYIKGYLLAEISHRSVVLKDEDTGEEFVLYINDEGKHRVAEKTEITEEAPEPSAADESKSAQARSTGGDEKKEKKMPPPKKAQTSAFLKKRLERHVKILKRKKSDLVIKQAERDYEKLKRLMPFMGEDERRDVIELRKQLDNVK
jgi:hypothetical protein